MREKMSKVKDRLKKFGVKKLVIIAAAVLVAVLVVIKLASGGGGTASASGYSYSSAEYRNITVSVNATSTVKALDEYDVKAMVKGEIIEANFQEGDTVNKDDVLFRIDSSDVDSTVRKAQEGVTNARLTVQQAQVNLSSAQDKYNDALDDLELNSKVSGQIIKLYYDPGDLVTAGSPVADVRDSTTMTLTVPFHSSDVSRIYAGQSASVTITSTGETLTGQVTEVSSIENVGIGGTLTRNVKISVNNPGGITNTLRATATAGGVACSGAGTFDYHENKTIYAENSGTIESQYVREGAWVSSGTTIYMLKGNNISSLRDSVSTAQINYQSASDALKAAQNSLGDAQDSLDDYTIKAPIAGTVVEMNYKVGDKLDTTDTTKNAMAVLYDLTALEVELNVDELDVREIALGQTASITADAVSGQTFSGSVIRIGVNGTAKSGVTTYPVTIRLDENNPEGLIPGMNVTADIFIEQADHVLTIPVSAVSRGNTVIVADETAPGDSGDNVPVGYKRVDVTLGRSDDDYIEILSGLSEGDVVAIDTSTSNIMESMMSMNGGGGSMGGGSMGGGSADSGSTGGTAGGN